MFRFDHVAISVSNPEKSMEFYSKFGFAFFKRYDDPNGTLSITLLKNKKMILELFCYKDFKPLPEHCEDNSKDLNVLGTKHFGLCVKDISKAASKVVELGILKELPEIKTGRLGRDYFFVKDPDGINVEIIEK